MIQLPRDAEGREIPLDTSELFIADGTKFVVTPGTNATLVDAIERTFHNCPSIGELTFRQMVDGDFVPDGTLRDYLLEGHRDGRWHYTEQDDYNRYIVNDKVYDRFEDIALAYSR